jgi:molybdopterin synthase catalytic subunit
MLPTVAVLDHPLDAAAIRRALTHPAAGSVVVFEGCARNHHEDRAVQELAYEAYPAMAEKELGRLREAAMVRFSLLNCVIHHRVGTVPLTEAAVVVGCASAHRQASFEALAWIMDEIKKSVPIWKRERYLEGAEAWVEGTHREP